MTQAAYIAVVGTLALSLGVLRFASHRRFRVRGRIPDSPRAARLQQRIHWAMLGSTGGLALVLIGAAAGWPRALLWAAAGLAALGWLVASVMVPLLVRARAGRSSRRRPAV